MIGVCIVTYNQEQFIQDAVHSVLAQKDCGHKICIYIADDCSTDNTSEICNKLAESNQHTPFAIKVVRNPYNLGLVKNTLHILEIMRQDGCDFIAMLDGDDFWCDPYKLYKQINYFERYPQVGLVHTCVDIFMGGVILPDKRKTYPEGNVFDIVAGYVIGNCSVVFRTKLLEYIDFEDFSKQGLMSCDHVMYSIFAYYTQFGFLPDHTAVWRRGHESVSYSDSFEKQVRYIENDIAAWKYLDKLFPDKASAIDENFFIYRHTKILRLAFNNGMRKRVMDEAALLEWKGLSPADKRRVAVSSSRILYAIWRFLRSAKKFLTQNWYRLKNAVAQVAIRISGNL